MQPESELGASKRKQTQINASNFAFFYLRLFFRFETFQWVTADSNKKNSLPLDSPVRLYLKRLVASAPSFWGTWESADFHQGKYTEGSRISQGFVRCNWGAAAKDQGSPMA